MRFRWKVRTAHRFFWTWLIIFLGVPRQTSANWMYLGIAASGAGTLGPNPKNQCNHVPGLVYQQLRVCNENPQAMYCVGKGAQLGILECHYQFTFERWNCTTTSNTSVFGPILSRGTRETAFIYAITSAGVVHAVTSSCSAGNLTDCSCDNTYSGQTTAEGWSWGGCSDNIDYGMWFARTFVDPPEELRHATTRDVRALANLHNNNVGREIVPTLMQRKCRCHGVSGSCAVKTCWRKMPSFREIGDKIKRRYDDSVAIAPRSVRKLRRRPKYLRKDPIGDLELVHVHHSPNYCKQDPNRGILGTRGRECKRNTKGADSCDLLCCGRGYNTEVVRYVERCHCKFVWCCVVKCKTCETMIDRHTCK